MDDYESLSHSKWECKYHVVFIPKCRRRALYGQLRKHLGEVFRKLAAQKELLQVVYGKYPAYAQKNRLIRKKPPVSKSTEAPNQETT